MRIFYDHQIFTYQQFGGISRYFAELMNKYSNIDGIDYLLGVKDSCNESLLNTGLTTKHNIDSSNSSRQFTRLACRYLKNNRYSKKLIKENNFDIYHPTFFFPSLSKHIGNRPLVLTILDMIPECFPEMYPKDSLYSKHITHAWIKGKKELVNKAQAIIAISEQTKIDLVEIYGINPEKVKVIYLGNSLFPKKDYKPELSLPNKYLLFVGTRNSYKNFPRFIKASAQVLKDDDELHVICIGGGSFSEDEKAMINSLNISKKVTQHNVSDSDLSYIYQNAQAFIFPSLYEGFGIPIIESFVSKCPTILSKSSCFPEIAGNAAEYFDPEDEESIARSIKRVIYDPKLQNSLREKGLARSERFTWENTAKETLEVYKNVLN